MQLTSLLPSGRARWTAIFVGAFFGAGLLAAWTILRPPIYRAEARLYFKSKDTGGLGAIPIIALGSNQDLNDTAGLLESFSVKKWVQQTMKLKEIDEVDKLIRYETHPEYSQILLAAENGDKEFALKAVTEAHRALRDVSQRTGFSLAKDKSGSLEKAINDNKALYQQAQQRSAAFEKRRKAPTKPDDPGTVSDYLKQAKIAEMDLADIKKQLEERRKVITRSGNNPLVPSGLPPAKKWNAVLQKLEYDLLTAQNTEGPMSPNVQRLKRDIASAQKKYAQELKEYLASVNQNIDEEFANLTVQETVLESRVKRYKEVALAAPDEAIQSQSFAQEVVTRGEVLKLLTQQFELAKVDAQVADAKWALIDPPHVLDEPVNKKLIKMAGIGIVGGAFIGLLWPLRKKRPTWEA